MYQSDVDEIMEMLKMAKEAGLDVKVLSLNEAGEVQDITEEIGQSNEAASLTLEAAQAHEIGLSNAEVEGLLNTYFTPSTSEAKKILEAGRSLPMRLRGFYGMDPDGSQSISRTDTPQYGWRFFGEHQSIRGDAAFYIEHLEARIKQLETERENAKATY